MSPPVTVAVVSWNTRELLARCLRSLAQDAAAGRAAVWVWDNASSDGSPELVEGEFAWARLVSSPANIGFGAAVNEVASRTESAWLVAANADVELTQGALEALLRAGGERPRAGIVAPRLVRADGSVQHSVHAFPSVAAALALELGAARLRPSLGDRLCLDGYWDPGRPRAIDWAHGALLLVRRHAFDEVGGFDPRQWMYAEDLDLAWRLDRAGWRSFYEPGAVVRHAVAASTSAAFGGERDAREWAAAYEWISRRRGLPVTRAYATVNVAGRALRLLALTPLAAASPSRFRRRRNRALRWLRIHRIGLRSGVLGRAP